MVKNMKLLIKGVDALASYSAPVLRGVDIGIEDDRILFISVNGDLAASDMPAPSPPAPAPSPPSPAPSPPAHAGFMPDRVINGAGLLAIPGLVNAHCHTAMTLLRGYADDMLLETWLFDRIFPAEAMLTDEDIYWGTSLGIAEMLRGGITCVNDMYLKMDNVAAAFRDSGMRARVSIGPLLTEKRGDALVDTDGCKAFFKRWDGVGGGRLGVNIEIHSIYLYTPDTLMEGARLAKEIGAAIHIHLLETATERKNMLGQFGESSVALAAKYGLLDSPVIAAHCVHVDDGDIELLRRKNASVAHNPTSNLKLASGIAPVPEMLGRGLNVCLGTDGAASNNTLDIFMEMRQAALIHKGVSGSPTTVAAGEAFRMATQNGADALGIKDAGTLAPGKKADIALISLDSPHIQPIHSHLSALVYAARASDVETVIADGRILLDRRKLTTIDEEKAVYMANRAAVKFSA